MCRLLGVTPNAYYQHEKRVAMNPDKQNDDHEMIDWLKELSDSSNNSYGSRRLRKALNALGYPIGRHRVRRLMKQAGISVRYRRKYKVTTNSNHKKPVFDNVLSRQFDVMRRDEAYVSDISYIWTQEGWLYLAVVIDLYSRKVVGWSMDSRMKSILVCDALKMALWQRKPKAGVIVHSDRGSQYASKPYRALLKAHHCIGSMSRKGDCWDNAVAESFFGSIKQELIQWRHYQTRLEAKQDILRYITMFYNPARLHSYLGYQSPMQYENELTKLQHVA
jgi:transposase InsO family protein